MEPNLISQSQERKHLLQICIKLSTDHWMIMYGCLALHLLKGTPLDYPEKSIHSYLIFQQAMKEGSFIKIKKNPGPGAYNHLSGLINISYTMRPKTSNPCIHQFNQQFTQWITLLIKRHLAQVLIIFLQPLINLGNILSQNINAMELIYTMLKL